MTRRISDKYREVQQTMLNRIFIDIYGLQGELTPAVADKDAAA